MSKRQEKDKGSLAIDNHLFMHCKYNINWLRINLKEVSRVFVPIFLVYLGEEINQDNYHKHDREINP